LLSQGNTLLTKTIKEKHFTDAAVAQGMLDAAKSEMKHVQKALKTVQENRKDLDNRKRKLMDKYLEKLEKKQRSKTSPNNRISTSSLILPLLLKYL